MSRRCATVTITALEVYAKGYGKGFAIRPCACVQRWCGLIR